MSEFFIYIITAIVSTASGSIVYFVRKHFKKLEKYAEEGEIKRAKKDLLVLKSLKAIGELCVANAIAIRDGKSNGCTKEALKAFEEVDKELNEFLMYSVAQSIKRRR